MKKKGIVIGVVCGVVGGMISIAVAMFVSRERKRVWCQLRNSNRFNENELMSISESLARLRRDVENFTKGGESENDTDTHSA